MDSSTNYYSSFILKIWVDEHGNVGRGHIQHIGTQKSIFFSSLDRVAEFIMCHLDQSQNGLSILDEDIELNPISQVFEIVTEHVEYV